MNPFGTGMPVDSIERLYYRKEAVNALENRISFKKQTLVLGVEGSGKSSLLRSFFNADYRKEKAKNEKILISPVTEFPDTGEADDVYVHFADMVVNAVRILGYCGKKEEMDSILAVIKDMRKEARNAKESFKATIEAVSDNGYRVVMIIDNFELFTSSKTITKEHHETLRTMMLDSGTQYIVSTNYDLNKDTLPADVSGSLFLMAFANNDIRLSGWSLTDTKEFLKNMLEGNRVQFSDELIAEIHRISGGIPMLLNLVAAFSYERISRYGSEQASALLSEIYEEESVQTLLSHWCKLISSEQKAVLSKFLNDEALTTSDEANLSALKSRGILNDRVRIDKYGRAIPDDNGYEACCGLLNKFLGDERRLKNAMKKNPFHEEDELEALMEKILDEPFDTEKPYVFISYAHANRREVYEDVCRLKKICNCWIDFENVDGGRVEGENDWTEKIKPVLDSEKCIGVISYFSPEAIQSTGVHLEANWIATKKCQLYTMFLNFREDERVIDVIDDAFRANRKLNMSYFNDLCYVSQAETVPNLASLHMRRKDFSHLRETDFSNWIKRIFG